MGNPYRVDLADTDSGVVLESRALTFTEAGNQPGGSMPDSWLTAHIETPLTADGNVSWILNFAQGADLEVDGVDATKINILTPGTYDFSIACDFQGDATGAGLAAISLTGDIQTQGWLAQASQGYQVLETIVPPNGEAVHPLVVPAVKVATPTFLQVSVGILASAGAITAGGGAGFSGGCGITVRRIA